MIAHLLRLLLLFCLLLLGSQLASSLPGFDAFNAQWVDAHSRHNGLQGVINFTLVAVCLLCIGLPRQLVAFMAGYAFGFVEGLIYSTIAAVLSCAIVALLCRYLARPYLSGTFAGRVSSIDRFMNDAPLLKSVIIRLMPVGNNLITNVVAGLSHVRLSAFFGGSTLGYLPQMAVFSLMGKGVVVNSDVKLLFSVALFALSGALGGLLFKKYHRASAIHTHHSSCANTIKPNDL